MSIKRSPEFRVLIECAQRHLEGTNAHNTRNGQPAGPVDWPTLLSLAKRHKIIPAVFSAMRSGHLAEMPSDTQEELCQENIGVTQRNLMLTGELIHIVRAFRTAEIPIISFKGPVLAVDLFGSINARQYSDLDLLIQRNDLFEGLTILEQLGYKQTGPDIRKIDSCHVAGYLSRFCDVHLIRKTPAGTGSVELHWRFVDDDAFYPANYDELFQAGHKVEVCGESIQTLPPAELLRYLSFHGTKHRCARMTWLCDFAKALNSVSKEAWQHVQKGATPQAERCLLAAVSMLQKLEFPVGFEKERSLQSRNTGIKSVVATMLNAIKAEQAFQESTLESMSWRSQLSGNLRAFLNPVLRSVLPKPEDLAKGGRVLPYYSRYSDVVRNCSSTFRRVFFGRSETG